MRMSHDDIISFCLSWGPPLVAPTATGLDGLLEMLEKNEAVFTEMGHVDVLAVRRGAGVIGAQLFGDDFVLEDGVVSLANEGELGSLGDFISCFALSQMVLWDNDEPWETPFVEVFEATDVPVRLLWKGPSMEDANGTARFFLLGDDILSWESREGFWWSKVKKFTDDVVERLESRFSKALPGTWKV